MTQQISVKDTRERLAEVIDQVAMTGNTFVITKFGKPRAMIVPVLRGTIPDAGIQESFGAWKKRKDIKDSAKWIEKLRSKMSIRNE